jgi:hypothetical protein
MLKLFRFWGTLQSSSPGYVWGRKGEIYEYAGVQMDVIEWDEA